MFIIIQSIWTKPKNTKCLNVHDYYKLLLVMKSILSYKYFPVYLYTSIVILDKQIKLHLPFSSNILSN